LFHIKTFIKLKGKQTPPYAQTAAGPLRRLVLNSQA